METCVSDSAHQYDTSRAEITRYADGGATYTYRVGPAGEETNAIVGQPPDGWRPELASDAELRRYAFPPRPDNDAGQEEWEKMARAFKFAAPPELCEGPESPTEEYPDDTRYSTIAASKNWSGYVANAPGQPGHWVASRAWFYQPSGNAYTSCKSHALVSNFVGLGGYNSGALIQAGTGAATSGSLTSWTVWTAGKSYNVVYHPLKFEAGSLLEVYAGYQTSIQTAYYYLINKITGEAILFAAEISPNYYDGTSAESITERVGTGEGTLYPLLNYNEVQWYWFSVQNLNNWVSWIDEVNNLRVEMTSTGKTEPPPSQLLAYPEPLYLSANYYNRYKNCQ